jgi:AcrR family transcriptional regulator
MPRNSERGGPLTRARILEVSNRLFVENGFDSVTVARIAREVGVSSVTVFNHFPTKEDLFLDRADEVVELLRSTVADRPAGVSAVSALEALAFRLVDEGEALSGTNGESSAFFRTVAASPALVARARQVGARVEQALVATLADDGASSGDAALLAVFFVAGYTRVLVDTAAPLVGGTEHDRLVADHRRRLAELFTALRSGVAAGDAGGGRGADVAAGRP